MINTNISLPSNMYLSHAGKIRYRKKVDGIRYSVVADSVERCYIEMSKLIAKHELEEEISRNKFDIEFEKWLNRYKIMPNKLTDGSALRLQGTWRNHIKGSILSEIPLDLITCDELQDFFNILGSKKSEYTHNLLSESTKKKVYILLSEFFRYYYRKKISENPMNGIIDNPFGNTNAEKIDEDKILTDEEMDLLIRECSKPFMPGTKSYLHGDMIITYLFTFARYGEIAALQKSDYDPAGHTLSISKTVGIKLNNRGKSEKFKFDILPRTKSRHGKRVIKISEILIPILDKKYNECIHDDDFLFHVTNKPKGFVSEQHINECFKSIIKKIGIDKKLTLHSLRHTGISYFIRHSASITTVSRMAGHSDVNITLKVYTQTLQEEQNQVISTINESSKIFSEDKSDVTGKSRKE